MFSAIFVINDWDLKCLPHYMLNNQFDTSRKTVLSCLSDKILDAPMYFGLHLFVIHMGTDTVRTALAIQSCSEICWTRMALQDMFVSIDFKIGDVLDLE